MVNTRLTEKSVYGGQTNLEVEDDTDTMESEHLSFSLLDSEEEEEAPMTNVDGDHDHSGLRTGPDCENMSSSLTDAIISSPSSSQSIEDYPHNRSSFDPGSRTGRGTRAKTDRRTAKQLTERKRRDRINALLDTLRTLILRLLRKNPRHHRKLEKADILELVVSFLKREIQKSKQRNDINTTSDKVIIRENKPITTPVISDIRYTMGTVPAFTEQIPSYSSSLSSSSSSPSSVSSSVQTNYQPISYDRYLSNFAIPMSPIPAPPYIFAPDNVPNPFTYPSYYPSGHHQFKPYISTNSAPPDLPGPFNVMINRKPLGSIENVKRSASSIASTHSLTGQLRSPLNDSKQAQIMLGPAHSRMADYGSDQFGVQSSTNEMAYKTWTISDENQNAYTHMQSLLTSKNSSQTLWRPYV